jgi:hypothetical protein
LCLFTCLASLAFSRAHHPAYLHALSDLRTARWLIEHVPGNWARTNVEVDAVRWIDNAINEIKRAAIDDAIRFAEIAIRA